MVKKIKFLFEKILTIFFLLIDCQTTNPPAFAQGVKARGACAFSRQRAFKPPARQRLDDKVTRRRPLPPVEVMAQSNLCSQTSRTKTCLSAALADLYEI